MVHGTAGKIREDRLEEVEVAVAVVVVVSERKDSLFGLPILNWG